MVFPVYEPPASDVDPAAAAELEAAASAAEAGAAGGVEGLRAAVRTLAKGCTTSGARLVRAWVEAECCASTACGTLARPAPDVCPGGCFGWRVEAAAKNPAPPAPPLGDRLEPANGAPAEAPGAEPFMLKGASGGNLWVGRGKMCDLMLEGEGLSTRHGLLRFAAPGEVYLTDHSTNGTWVRASEQASELRLEKGREMQLTDGNVISFGSTLSGGGCSYTYAAAAQPEPDDDEETALLSVCWAALSAAGEAEPAALAAAFASASEPAAIKVLRTLYDAIISQSLRIEAFVTVLSCLAPTTRRLFETGALVQACAARRSPIDSDDYTELASRHYCEVCHAMETAEGGAVAVTPCPGCGVSAYCCAEHASKDKLRHDPWCNGLLLSRLLWQCALPAAHYERLRRSPPPLGGAGAENTSTTLFKCRGRPVGPNGPSRLPRWPAFWSAGWSGYFEAARETETDQGAALDRMLSTDSLSSIMTVRYGLHKLGLDREPSLTLYMLGAVFEASQPWEELLAWLPETHTLNLVLTGPDTTSAPPMKLTTTAGMETIAGEKVTVTVHAINGLYHWMTKVQKESAPTQSPPELDFQGCLFLRDCLGLQWDPSG